MAADHGDLDMPTPVAEDACFSQCFSVGEPIPSDYGRTLVELRNAEKSYGAAEDRTLFIPEVLKEVASRLGGFTVPFADSPTAGELADASPSTPIWEHAEV